MASTNEVPGLDVDREFLAQIPIFGGLPAEVVERIARATRVLRVPAGVAVFEEGELARSMFIVRAGDVEICKRGRDGADFCLAVLPPGACVGEMALIDIQPRSATVRAVTEATMYIVDQKEIGSLHHTDRDVYTLLVLNIAREISRRLRYADQVMVDLGIAVRGTWMDTPSPTAVSR